MDKPSDYEKIVDQIYDAAFNEETFTDLPKLIARAANGRSSTVQFLNPAGELSEIASTYYSAEMAADYAQNFWDKDIWVEFGRRNSPNSILAVDDFIPVTQFKMTSLYNDFFRAHGDDTAHCLGGYYTTGHGSVVFATQRSETPGAFTHQETKALESLAPHLCRLHGLRRQVNTQKSRTDLATLALDKLAHPVILVNASARVLLSNSAGEEVLRRRDGLFCRGTRLHSSDPSLDAQLLKAIFEATKLHGPRSTSIALPRRETLTSRMATVAPMPDRKCAAIMLDAGFETTTLTDQVKTLFKLSPAEAALTCALATGRTLEDIALERDVHISTLRTQLSSVLRKTDTARQSKLIALIGSIPRLGA